MKVDGIEWIKNNKEKLSSEEIESLNEYNFFEQVENGELEMPLVKIVELMDLIIDIVTNHNN